VTSPLKVSLDASAVPPRPAGAGRYVLELVRALGSIPHLALEVEAKREDGQRWRALNERATVHEVVPTARPLRLAYEQLRLGRVAADQGAMVYHGPHYTLPRNCPIPMVATIHDLTFFDRPELHERKKVKFFQSAIRYAAANAAVVVCVSDATARRFRELFSNSVDVIVAPHGIDHERFTPTEPSPGFDARVLERYGVRQEGKRIVQVGTLEPRKGCLGLLNAVELLDDGKVDLVFVGQRGWGLEEFDAALSRSPAKDRVHLVGYVPDDEISAFLRTASVVAYPSIEEGFGLPALEALACGAPLVTTQGSVMDELSSGAAWTVVPGDVGQLATALDAAMAEGSEDLDVRRKRGIEVAAGFRWERTAALHMEAYELAATSMGSRGRK
jgi:glycosyltransferase involved in cell wall biosynthesis